MQIAVRLVSPWWKMEKVSAEGDGSPEERHKAWKEKVAVEPTKLRSEHAAGREGELPQTAGSPVPVRPHVEGGQQRPRPEQRRATGL